MIQPTISYPPQESTDEVQTLRRELAVSRKKLQEYADTIVSLLGELRTLRDSLCQPCKQNIVLANFISSQAADSPAVDPSSFVNRTPQSHSQGPAELTNSRRHPLEEHVSDKFTTSSGPPTHRAIIIRTTDEKPASTSTSTPNIVPWIPRWSVRRNATDAVLQVTFVNAFHHNLYPVRSVRFNSLRFSADGRYLAAALSDAEINGKIYIYDVETGKRTCVLTEHASQYLPKEKPGINCVCFSLDGRYLVCGDSSCRVTVWDIPNKRVRNIFIGHEDRVRSVDFSPNGRLVVSASADKTVRVWNMRGSCERLFTPSSYETSAFTSVRFSPNGRSVVVGESDDGLLRIWDIRSGQLKRCWFGHSGVSSVAFTPDGKGLVSSGPDGVKCWKVSFLGTREFSRDPVSTKILDSKGYTHGVQSIAVSPEGRWIAITLSNRVIIWDAHRNMSPCALTGHVNAVSSVDFSPAGSFLALGSHDGHISLWRYENFEMF